MREFDVVVVGGGPGGYVAAIRAAQRGATVALVEKGPLGGVCLNWGCIPTKALIYSAELYRKMQHAAEYGLEVDGIRFNMKALLKRKNAIVRRNTAGVKNLMKANSIEVIAGEAQVTAAGRVAVGEEEIAAKAIILATGSQPAQLPGLEIDGKQVISSTEALDLEKLPERIAVIGAGALGAEFACLWNIMGVDVTLIEMMPYILPLEDAELSDRLAGILKKRGMDIRTGTKVAKLDKRKNHVALELEGDHAGKLKVDVVLVGIGRKFNSEVVTSTPDLGVKVNPRGAILVDDRMATSVLGIYAIGDVTAKTMLAHGASREGLVAADNATGGEARMDYRVVPACTFTSPEIAHVGLTETQARDQGIDVKVGRFDFLASGRAHTMGETDGMAKIIADSRTDEVVGVHILGPEAGELIAAPALAMSMEATVAEIAHTIHTHPTLSETIMEAAEDYFGKGIHTPPRARG